MRHFQAFLAGFVLLPVVFFQMVGPSRARGDDLPMVNDVEVQPFAAQVKRVIEALEMLGQPLAASEKTRIDKALAADDQKAAVRKLQEVLDPHCLIGININPESRVKSAQGLAAPRLVQNGWTVFLVKVLNEAGVTAELLATSPNAEADVQAIDQQCRAKKDDRSLGDHPAVDGPGPVS